MYCFIIWALQSCEWLYDCRQQEGLHPPKKKKSSRQKMLIYVLTWNVLSAPLGLHYLTQCNTSTAEQQKKQTFSVLKLYCGKKKKSNG